MPDIDWDLIGALEGGRFKTGYVPNGAGDKSGVTIATGVDLGQRDAAELRRMGLSDTLVARLRPYLGVRGAAARALLRDRPLTIDGRQAAALDSAIKDAKVREIARQYRRGIRRHTGRVLFDALPDALATVYASVAYQYGANLPRATPNFFRAVSCGDWAAAYLELRDFKDGYPTRRNREADYLAAAMREAGLEVPDAGAVA